MAEETWPHDGGVATDTETIFEQIVKVPGIEGVTFLGGEPFEQPEAVAALAERIKAGTGLSVVTFTGRMYEELRSADDPDIRKILASTDLLIDGPFIQEQFDLSRPWVGSLNQRFHFLSGRYSGNDLIGIQNQIELRIATNGTILINGMGDFLKIKEHLRGV